KYAPVGDAGLDFGVERSFAQGVTNSRFQSVEPLAPSRADGDGTFVMGFEHIEERPIGNLVGLVEDEQGRVFFETQLCEHFLDGLNLTLRFGARCIDDVQEQIGLARLLEGGLERSDQRVRQVSNKADRVGKKRIPPTAKSPAASARVERCK